MCIRDSGRAPCYFFGSADLSISKCAWRRGVYLANHRQIRPFLGTGPLSPLPLPQKMYGWDTTPTRLQQENTTRNGVGNAAVSRPGANDPLPGRNTALEQSVDVELCTATISIHYMDARYRSKWMECNLVNKYYFQQNKIGMDEGAGRG